MTLTLGLKKMMMIIALVCCVATAWAPAAVRPKHHQLRMLATAENESSMPLVGAPFDADYFPSSAQEMIEMYVAYSASRGKPISVAEAQRDVQAFMADEPLASKWKPVLQEAAKERAKLTPVEMVNLFTSYALPVAVGITLFPILRGIADKIPFVNDVVLPQVDAGFDFAKRGVQRIIELPICLEFGDC